MNTGNEIRQRLSCKLTVVKVFLLIMGSPSYVRGFAGSWF